MNVKSFDIRKALLESGKQEFLARGFKGASLRAVCKRAEVTTGAFYSYFDKKEELFAAIIDPMLEEYYKMYDAVFRRSLEDIKTNEANELAAITFISAHRDEFRLLFDCSEGTKYEGFKQKLIEEVFVPTYQACFDHYLQTKVDPDIVRVFVQIKFHEYMELIFGDYTTDKIKKLTGLYAAFADAGVERIVQILQDTSAEQKHDEEKADN